MFPAVAPLAGAWIEISLLYLKNAWAAVAPLAGAWIEINQYVGLMEKDLGRSPRGSVD